MDKMVDKLIRKHKTNNPFIIAQNLNVHIRYDDLGKQTRGIYHRTLRRRFIVINNRLSTEWQHFICAHELGHDRLHKGINRFFIDECSYFNVGKFERQANRFALQLLIAEDTIKQGEQVSEFLLRNGVPEELHHLYE